MLEKRLRQNGIDVYETDIRPPEGYLVERFMTAPLAFDGQPVPTAGEIVDAFLKPAPGYRPRLKAVSLDSVTSRRGRAVFDRARRMWPAPGVHACRFNGSEDLLDFTLDYCNSRAEMIEQLCQRMERHDSDVIIGWNVLQFDFRVLPHQADLYRVPLRLGGGAAACSNDGRTAAKSIALLQSPAASSSMGLKRSARHPGISLPSVWSMWRKRFWIRQSTRIPSGAWGNRTPVC
jgi:DNA polymerase elongation subunit (family B)